MTDEYGYMKVIVDKVNSLGIKDTELTDELIDHYCTMYESRNTDNFSESFILSDIIQQIDQLDISHLIKSKRNMTPLKITGIAALVILCSLLLRSNLSSSVDMPTSNSDTAVSQDLVYEVLIQDPPYGSPIPDAAVVSGFGPRKHPITKEMKHHRGCDLRADIGTPVISVEVGTVVDCGYDKKYGNYIEIQHDEIYSTRYHHLNSISVEKGQKIEKQQKIGEVGSTGLSTGPHLHYEIIKSGQWVDVAEYLKA